MNRSPGPTARTRTRSPDGPCESRRSCSRAPSSSVGVGIWPTLRTLSAVCHGSSSLSWPGPAALQPVAVPGVRGVLGKRLGIEDTAGDAAGDGHRHSSDVGWCRIGWSAWRSWSKTPLRHASATANVWSSVRKPPFAFLPVDAAPRPGSRHAPGTGRPAPAPDPARARTRTDHPQCTRALLVRRALHRCSPARCRDPGPGLLRDGVRPRGCAMTSPQMARLDEHFQRLRLNTALPLQSQPGTEWFYSISDQQGGDGEVSHLDGDLWHSDSSRAPLSLCRTPARSSSCSGSRSRTPGPSSPSRSVWRRCPPPAAS